MPKDRLSWFAEFREMLGLTVNQLKYLQLKDCVTNSLHHLSFFFSSLLNKGPEITAFANEVTHLACSFSETGMAN